MALASSLLVAGCDSGSLPSEARAAKLFDAKNEKIFGKGPPYTCRRTEGDESVKGIVKDIDFICTPLKDDGSKCSVGECAGFVVDFKNGKIVDYGRFGGP
ncbi:MAG: hypothetical protein U0470_11780 [Anaerolineae bacterium]